MQLVERARLQARAVFAHHACRQEYTGSEQTCLFRLAFAQR